MSIIFIVHSLNGQQGAIQTNDMKANVSSFTDVWSIKCSKVKKHLKVKCVKLLQMMS